MTLFGLKEKHILFGGTLLLFMNPELVNFSTPQTVRIITIPLLLYWIVNSEAVRDINNWFNGKPVPTYFIKSKHRHLTYKRWGFNRGYRIINNREADEEISNWNDFEEICAFKGDGFLVLNENNSGTQEIQMAFQDNIKIYVFNQSTFEQIVKDKCIDEINITAYAI